MVVNWLTVENRTHYIYGRERGVEKASLKHGSYGNTHVYDQVNTNRGQQTMLMRNWHDSQHSACLQHKPNGMSISNAANHDPPTHFLFLYSSLAVYVFRGLFCYKIIKRKSLISKDFFGENHKITRERKRDKYLYIKWMH